MTVTVTSGEIHHVGAFRSSEALTNSTSTAVQEVSLSIPISTISGGTATGFGVNRYLLSTASAVEGQEKIICMLATGEAYVVYTGTATGAQVLSAADDYVWLKYFNETWKAVDVGSATAATATGTA